MSNTSEGPASQSDGDDAISDNHNTTASTAATNDNHTTTSIATTNPSLTVYTMIPFRFTDFPLKIRQQVWEQAMIDVIDTYYKFHIEVIGEHVRFGRTMVVNNGVALVNSRAIPKKHLDLMGACFESRQKMHELMYMGPITVYYKPKLAKGRKFVGLPHLES